MRLKGRQGRFLATSLAGWVALRIVIALPDALPPDAIGQFAWEALAWPHETGDAPFRVAKGAVMRIGSGKSVRRDGQAPAEHVLEGFDLVRAMFDNRHNTPNALLRRAVFASVPGEPPSPPPPMRVSPAHGPIAAQAYLFLRPGSGRAALAPGGSLGASQVAARIAVSVAPRLALVARAYAPLQSKGAEAALGLDVSLSDRIPLRASIERRQKLDALGRSAWSAYVAGGAYTALPGGIELDGYAQAGFVGARRRDAFVDGAIRGGMRLGRAGPIVGAGVWGAAQPGVSRLDVGPRAVMRLPLADHALSLAIEGRLRVAGRASPGSGVALTLAADL